MRTFLSIFASVSILLCAGCASGDGSRSPWSAGGKAESASAPEPAAYRAPAPAAAFDSADFNEDRPAPAAGDNSPLAAYPALRQANKERALAEIDAAKADVAPLPIPDENKARIIAYNTDCTVLQFDSGATFKVGDRVVLSKAGAHALVKVVSVVNANRYVAEEVAGVVGGPMLVPGDDVDCTTWIDPEDIAAVAAAAEKAKKNSDNAVDAVADDDDDEEDDAEEIEEEEEE